MVAVLMPVCFWMPDRDDPVCQFKQYFRLSGALMFGAAVEMFEVQYGMFGARIPGLKFIKRFQLQMQGYAPCL